MSIAAASVDEQPWSQIRRRRCSAPAMQGVPPLAVGRDAPLEHGAGDVERSGDDTSRLRAGSDLMSTSSAPALIASVRLAGSEPLDLRRGPSQELGQRAGVTTRHEARLEPRAPIRKTAVAGPPVAAAEAVPGIVGLVDTLVG